jgi:multidrug efflux pump subunit AcrB
LGITAGTRMPVDILPLFQTPAVQVVTFYPGMPAEVMEKDISTRLERWTGQSAGIARQESRSMIGVSIVKDFFHEGVDPVSAIAQVSSYAMSDLFYLPPGTIPPMVMQFDPTATVPLALITVSSPTFDETKLYDVAYFDLRNRLQGISGVTAPAVYGGKLRRVLAYVDRGKLQARGLSPMDVVQTLRNFSTLIPTGDAKLGDLDYQVITNAAFFALNDVEGPKGNDTITLSSVAYDAGSKPDDELCANIPGPAGVCSGTGFVPGSTDCSNSPGCVGYVFVHRGIHGIGDLDASKFDWRNPVAQIVIQRLP